MSNLSSAQVQSLAAVQEFRPGLVQFRAEIQDALSSLALDLRRAHDWLADQKRHWDKAMRETHDEVVHAKAELTRRQTVPPGDRVPDTSQQEEDLARAQAKLKYAESKAEACRRWHTQLERAIEEYDGPVRRLGTRVELDFPKALAALERIMQRLEAYLSTHPDSAARPT